ncbi:MAG: PKD domain-containing protein [Thermoplasmata archaeon]
MTIPEDSPSRRRAHVIWIAVLLLGSGFWMLTTPAAASDGMFAPPHADEGWDTDADNRFEFLVVNVTVSVTVAGDFTVEGTVLDFGTFAFITNNSTAFSGGVGLHVVSLNFEARDIFESRFDGPYRVSLDLLNDTMVPVHFDVHITGPYDHVSFGPIFAFTPPHTDVGLDTDGNGRFNFIQVNLSANTSLPGFFFVSGGIFSSGTIDFKIKLLNLTAGDHIIPFNFSGIGAFINGDDGPYSVLLSAGVIDCGRDRSGEGDSGNHTTAAYFFTDFEFGVKRDLTGSVTNGTTGQPVANETVWLANATHRWAVSLETDASGDFRFVAFEGDFVLLAGADGLQDEAIPVTISGGGTNVAVILGKEDVEASELDLVLPDWGNLTVHTDMYGYADNQSERFLVDQFVGNGDLSVDANESDQWIEVFRTCFTPTNDTTGQFEVDGIPFSLDDGTFVMDADLTGPVTSTAPTLTTMDMNFTAQSPIPSLATHEVFFRASYDDENETEVTTLTLPSAWVLDSFWPVSNVTVGPLDSNTITIDPLGRPLGDPPSVGVVMNATLDTTPPVLSNVTASPDPSEVFGSVAIAATVTDNSGVASVWVNITDPSGGAVCNCSMANQAGSDNYTYAASFGMLGLYNFTVWAEDDAGLFASASGNFTVQDTTPPSVGTPSASPNPQEAGMTVNFAVVVSDNFQVDTVTIAIVDPEATPVGNFTMTFVGGEWTHAQVFTKLGVYTMTVWANDTSGNLASNGGTFTIADSAAPQIHNHTATPDPQEVFGSVSIYANVSDNSAVAGVWVNITDPGGLTVGNFTMSGLGGGQYLYAAAYGSLGTFTYTVWAEDDGGLFSSASGSFAVQDTTLPTVGLPSAGPSPQEAGQPVDFSVNVSDNFAVASVTLAIRDPSNALLGNFTMTGVAGTYSYSDTFTDTGTYTYTVWASDTSGNVDSGGGQFTVEDTTPPQVNAASASPDPLEVAQAITITADVADNAGITSVSVWIEDPLGAPVGNFTMAAVDADTYEYTLSPNDLGVYNFTVWVTDGEGFAGSRNGNFTVRDSMAPTIGLPAADPDPQELGQSVAISAQVSDNDGVTSVTIAIEDPDANPVSNVSMTFVSGNYTHMGSFGEPGTYSYTIWAVDASGNGASRTGAFTIQDSAPPAAVASGPTEVDVGVVFTLDASGSSDNHRIANYTWDLGDGTILYGETTTHAYDDAGDYTITLTVRDASGNEDTDTLSITAVAAAPGGGFELADTTLYGLLAALAVAGITAGFLYWRRGARAGPRGPTTPPKGGAREKPPAKVAEEPPEEPPEPEMDDLDEEIEKLLKT